MDVKQKKSKIRPITVSAVTQKSSLLCKGVVQGRSLEASKSRSPPKKSPVSIICSTTEGFEWVSSVVHVAMPCIR